MEGSLTLPEASRPSSASASILPSMASATQTPPRVKWVASVESSDGTLNARVESPCWEWEEVVVVSGGVSAAAAQTHHANDDDDDDDDDATVDESGSQDHDQDPAEAESLEPASGEESTTGFKSGGGSEQTSPSASPPKVERKRHRLPLDTVMSSIAHSGSGGPQSGSIGSLGSFASRWRLGSHALEGARALEARIRDTDSHARNAAAALNQLEETMYAAAELVEETEANELQDRDRDQDRPQNGFAAILDATLPPPVLGHDTDDKGGDFEHEGGALSGEHPLPTPPLALFFTPSEKDHLARRVKSAREWLDDDHGRTMARTALSNACDSRTSALHRVMDVARARRDAFATVSEGLYALHRAAIQLTRALALKDRQVARGALESEQAGGGVDLSAHHPAHHPSFTSIRDESKGTLADIRGWLSGGVVQRYRSYDTHTDTDTDEHAHARVRARAHIPPHTHTQVNGIASAHP